jgi:hypothetical protein
VKRLISRYQFHPLAIFAVMAAITSATPAHAATVSHFKLRDHSLIANFEAASDDGCFVAQTFIEFAESVTQVDGTTIVGEPTTLLEVDYANACTGDVLSLTGGTTVQTVSIGGDLSSASLSAVIPVTDGTNSATVTLNVTWTANGDVQVAKGHFRSTDGNTTTMDKFDLHERDAVVGGSITTSLPLAAGPTPIQLAAFQEGGMIGSGMDGERSVTKKH